MSEEANHVKKPSLIGMITSPGEQFDRIKERPVIWGAMIILSIVSAISGWLQTLGLDLTDLELEDVPAESLPALETFTQITATVTSLFLPLFSVLISSAIYLLIARIARSQVTFKQLFSMNTYIMVIVILGALLNGILIALIGGNEQLSYTSLGALINAEGAIGSLLNSIEVFTIWSVILTALGLEKVADFSKGWAWGVAVGFFIIGAILTMVLA